MFEDRLIEAVKRNPCIYDKSLRSYRNKEKKRKSWSNVSSFVGVDVRQCQIRWRSLRDRFLKELHRKPSLDDDEDDREWQYFSALQFLEGHVGRRTTTTFPKSEWNGTVDMVDVKEASPSRFVNEGDFDHMINGQEEVTTKTLMQMTPDGSQTSDDTHSIASDPRKRKIVEQATDRLNTLLEAASQYLAKKKVQGRNDHFYRVLDGYLIKLPEDTQDDLKAMFLRQVFDEIQKHK